MDCTGSIPDVRLGVQVFEDAVEERQGTHDLDMDIGELRHRSIQAAEEGHEGDHGPQGELLRDDQIAAHEIDQRRAQRLEHLQQHAEPPAEHVCAHLRVHQLAVSLAEPEPLVGLLRKCLHQQETADVQRLLHDG